MMNFSNSKNFLKLLQTSSCLIKEQYFWCSETAVRYYHHVNKFTERTHTCGQLTKDDIGKQVKLFGWIQYTRFDNRILSLRDSYGVAQCIVAKEILTKEFKRTTISNESVVKIIGSVRARPDNQINRKLLTGDIEVLVEQIDFISIARKSIPILTRENTDHSLKTRLKYRHLDLRDHHMQEALRTRSMICQILRQKLYDLSFVECETPTLFKRTPGGANEFIVPTQIENKFYSLTQSPQQLKQLLMIAGLDRYFQISRCYRDEACRTDRQPEFTQLDIELSFTNQGLVMELVDELIYDLLDHLNRKSNMTFDLESMFGAGKSVPRMTHQQAMEQYGVDKPDTRFPWLIELKDGNIFIDVPHKIDEIVFNQILNDIERDKQIDASVYNVDFDLINGGKTRISINHDSMQARELLGSIRLYLAGEISKRGFHVYDKPYSLLWITDFPLFEEDKRSGDLLSSHHPFTAPSADTLHLINIDPTKVIGQHYDLILNGQEIAGGSIRVHDADLQISILTEILKLELKNFEYFIEALRDGCPPHGGIAFGLDRLIAILLQRDSIREVIAFPKSTTGRDVMSDSPHELDAHTKKMYHLK